MRSGGWAALAPAWTRASMVAMHHERLSVQIAAAEEHRLAQDRASRSATAPPRAERHMREGNLSRSESLDLVNGSIERGRRADGEGALSMPPVSSPTTSRGGRIGELLLGRRGAWPDEWTEWILEGLSHLALALPAILATYALVRFLGLPSISLVLLIGFWFGLRQAWAPRRARAKSDGGRIVDPVNAVVLILILICVLAPPMMRLQAVQATDGARFFFHDEAYLIAIARGQAKALPPPDLLFAGHDNEYHQGGALLVEGLVRASGVTYPVAFYGLAPVVVSLALVGGCWRLFGVLTPLASPRLRLLACAAVGGILFVDPLAIAWNLRNAIATGTLSWGTALVGVPVAGRVAIPGLDLDFLSGGLAAVLLLGAAANLNRGGGLALGAAFSAVYLVKGQLGFPAIAGLVAAAAWCSVQFPRRWEPLAAVLCSIPFLSVAGALGPEAGTVDVALGAGANLRSAAELGRPYAQALDWAGFTAAAGLGLVLWLSRWLMVGGYALVGARHGWRKNGGDRCLTTLMVTTILAALGFATVVVVTPGPLVSRQFEVTHREIGESLWLPYESYLDRMFTEISAGVANRATILLAGTLAVVGVVASIVHARTGPWKRFSTFLLGAMVATALVSSALLSGPRFRTALDRSKRVEPNAIRALERIPVDGTVVLTNDLAYDEDLAPQHPLMNSWAPALFGHQFWVADFMFDLHYPGLEERFLAWTWFWETPASVGHGELMRREKIDWILERRARGALDPSEIDGVQLVYENPTYRVFRYPPGDLRGSPE